MMHVSISHYSTLFRFSYSPSLLAGDLNWYNPDTGETVVYNLGDIAWIISATALVWIMIPGVGYFYSGLLRRKNALSMIFLGVAVLAVVSFQWFFWGFSLAFSDTASKFIGDLSTSPLLPFITLFFISFLRYLKDTSPFMVYSSSLPSVQLASHLSCSASTNSCSPPSLP